MTSIHGLRSCASRAVAVLVAAVLASCGKGVGSEESARRVYLGLDRAIDRAINLGFDGFNAATSANIPPQSAPGDVAGTLTVTGQVDQGASDNKQMRLRTAFAMYTDSVSDGDGGQIATRLVYDSRDAALPQLDMSLRSIPSGTVTGTLNGTLTVSGDLSGEVTLALAFSGRIEPVPGTTDRIRRVAGSTTITGMVRSQYGTYNVNLTR
jgi:hypothetical protein